MKFVFIFAVALLACLNIVSSSRIQPRIGDFPDIKRIRAKQSKQPEEINPNQSPTFSVLAHMAQTQALRPRRRDFSPRIGQPLPLEPQPQPLPLEPQPQPLPLEQQPQPRPLPIKQRPREDFVVYRPRPEGRPQSIRKPTFDLSQGEIQKQVISQHQFTEDAQAPVFHSRRRPDPLIYEDDETIFRKHPKRPAFVEEPKEPPTYTANKPVFQGQIPVYIPKSSNPTIQKVMPSYPRRTRHRNRPQYSGEVQIVREPEVINHPPQEEENEYMRRPETFDFPREKEPIQYTDQTELVKEELQQPKAESVFRTPGYRRHEPKPIEKYTEEIPIKLFKRKKVNAYNTFPASEDFKKDKRGSYKGGSLDENGIEFVEEAKKVEHGNHDGRMAFQIHGQQGPHSYRFGFDTGKGENRQFRYEERDGYGEVKGRYGFYDKHGKLQIVNYSAHPKHGFHADVPHH